MTRETWLMVIHYDIQNIGIRNKKKLHTFNNQHGD